MLEDQDMKDLATTFSCLPATTCISFRISRTKRLIGIIHWVQDHESVSLTTSIAVGTKKLDMRDAHSKVLECENSRSYVANQAKAAQAGVDPGELESDKRFYGWDDKRDNFLSTIPRNNGVPLSHVIRSDSTPEHQLETPCSTFSTSRLDMPLTLVQLALVIRGKCISYLFTISDP